MIAPGETSAARGSCNQTTDAEYVLRERQGSRIPLYSRLVAPWRRIFVRGPTKISFLFAAGPLERFKVEKKRGEPVRRLASMCHGRVWCGHPRLPLQPQEDPVFSHREIAPADWT